MTAQVNMFFDFFNIHGRHVIVNQLNVNLIINLIRILSSSHLLVDNSNNNFRARNNYS